MLLTRREIGGYDFVRAPRFLLVTGFDTENLLPPVWVGGESEALARLERHLERKAWVASFGRPKMTPQSLLPSQTGLSPYLRFGCLSTRLFYYQLTDLYKKVQETVRYRSCSRNDNAWWYIYCEIYQQLPWRSLTSFYPSPPLLFAPKLCDNN